MCEFGHRQFGLLLFEHEQKKIAQSVIKFMEDLPAKINSQNVILIKGLVIFLIL